MPPTCNGWRNGPTPERRATALPRIPDSSFLKITMSLPSHTTILFVPGLRDHVADHWQTLLQAELPHAASVPPLEHDKLSCAARIAALDNALDKALAARSEEHTSELQSH